MIRKNEFFCDWCLTGTDFIIDENFHPLTFQENLFMGFKRAIRVNDKNPSKNNRNQKIKINRNTFVKTQNSMELSDGSYTIKYNNFIDNGNYAVKWLSYVTDPSPVILS